VINNKGFIKGRVVEKSCRTWQKHYQS